MNRRRFLKYAGGAAVAAGAAAGGYYTFPANKPTTSTTTTPTMTSTRTNSPPIVSEIEVKPRYINPTDQQTVQFTNKSYDLDGDPLTYRWIVDSQPVSEDKDCSAKLPVGQHFVRLEVSDGYYNATTDNKIVTVEPDQIYQPKPLRMKYKGMNYAAARVAPDLTVTPRVIPDHDKLTEQLGTIYDELGCNGVSIWAGAGYEDNLIEACKIAAQKPFDRIYALAKYAHFSLDDIAEKLRNLAPRITELREDCDKIVWVIGNEFILCVKDLIPGDTLADQQRWMTQHNDAYWKTQKTKIPEVFERIIPIIRDNYDYTVAYHAEKNEIDFVPWNDSIFESVCWNAYLHPKYGEDETFLINKFAQLGRFGKPIIVSEFGSATYTGAAAAGMTGVNYQGQPYDEDEQANSIDRYCKMLNRAPVEGAFVYIYNEEWDKGFGLYNGTRRKKGFYMYKSYEKAT